MTNTPDEEWCLLLRVPHTNAPPAVTVRRILKNLLRSWGVRCVGYSVDQKLFELQTEVERLQAILDQKEGK